MAEARQSARDGDGDGDRAGAGRAGDVDALRRWRLQQLCDYVSVESGPDGVSVLLAINVT